MHWTPWYRSNHFVTLKARFGYPRLQGYSPCQSLRRQVLSRFWDPNPPTFCNTNFLQRWSHKDALAFPTRNVKLWAHSSNLFRCTFSTWISSARAINEQVICCTSPASGQRTLGKWRLTKSEVTTHISSSGKLPIQSPKHSSHIRYMILAVI